jgi:uncharacterized protein
MSEYKFLIILLLIFILPVIMTGCLKDKGNNKAVIIINGQKMDVDVVKIGSDLQKGLSGRPSLCASCGMLFVFQDYQPRNFWMKEMKFPLDVIWIKDMIVVGMAENIPVLTDGQITRMKSGQPVNQVLEINAGQANNFNLKIGDRIGIE